MKSDAEQKKKDDVVTHCIYIIIYTSGNNQDHCENQKEHLSLHFGPEKNDNNTEERASF